MDLIEKSRKRKKNPGLKDQGNSPAKKPKAKPGPKTKSVRKPAKSANDELKNVHDTNYSEAADEQDNLAITSSWDEAEMLSKLGKVSMQLSKNFIGLLTEGCLLPFIARYRKTAVENLMPDRLQDLFEQYQNICLLKKKVKSVLESLKKSKKLTPDIEKSILCAHSLAEVEFIYAPLKSNTLSLAERARKLGLEQTAVQALNGAHIDLRRFIADNEELSTVEKVESHVTHIVADIIYKDTRVLERIRMLKGDTRFTIQSSRTKSSLKVKEDQENKKKVTKSDPETYKLYFDWKCLSQFVKPHQMLALNRGEDEKILSVKVVVPDGLYYNLERFCLSLWRSSFWVKKALNDAYNRLIKPWLSRQVRSELTSIAQKEAVKTFTNNLEKYLLTEPIKNRRIAGLDPGFKAGCKVGVIDRDGQKLEAFTIYPAFHSHNEHDPAAKQLKEILEKHSVELIGLGNGTACRETELWLKNHHITADTPIVIVPEQGASIYSISKEAQKEHPNMDPNLISALSIARRVLDPMGELIKVEPKNLGVGLYQHDIPAKMLESALDCAVEKVVSLVGVDVNTASQALLRRIAGLNDGRAKKLIEYRSSHGGFSTREEILKVPGIGKVTFQQCSGFLKVVGGAEPLDSTVIHPESYKVAKSFAKQINVNIKDLAKPHFPQTVERNTSNVNLYDLTKDLKTDVSTLELIVNAFKQKATEEDIICFCKPVYSLAVQNLEQIREGMTVTGVVRNVVPFGCFVDVGVGDSGLVHRSQMGGLPPPTLGDRVSVTVIPSTKPGKLQLKLVKILH